MAFRIERCTVEDGPAVARNNFPAFWEDESWRLVWKHRDLPYVIQQGELRAPGNLLKEREKTRHLKAVDTATGQLVGYARWKLPDVPSVDTLWPEAQTPDVSPELRKFYADQTAATVWDYIETGVDESEHPRLREGFMAGKSYLYLDYLAVHPNHQRRGIGTLLVKAGLDAGDALGFDTFVTAFHFGVPTYNKLGFVELAACTMDDSAVGGPGEYTYTLMEKKRTPREG